MLDEDIQSLQEFQAPQEDLYILDEHQLEAENRIRNLVWTISGDYTLDVQPDLESFRKSKYIALYDAVKQGAFSKFFDRESLSMYIVKKYICRQTAKN